jgi:alanine-synthesizing transaminase
MFSARTSWDRTPNRQTVTLHGKRAEGRAVIDLTESNPTRVELVDLTALVAELGHPRGAFYEPAALGVASAREAVAQHYARRGWKVDPHRVVITASTSEAYAWLFSLLADPEDAVLVPRPSYPLLGWIAGSQHVQLTPYQLGADVGFRIDFDDLTRAITARTRAIVLVHPNNPTGSFLRRDDADRLCEVARRHDLALIVDEVFADYAVAELPPGAVPSFVTVPSDRGVAIFVMSGLSKVLLSPQLKLGWIVASGPAALIDEALARLELIGDTFLSVSTPVQLALPALLASEGSVQQAVKARTRQNLRQLDDLLDDAGRECPVRRLQVEGGWYAILEVPRIHDEEAWVDALLGDDDVLVQPGYFFDFERDGYLVLSLLPKPEIFREGVARIVRRVGAVCRALT